MSLIIAKQEVEDWVELLSVSGVDSMNMAPDGTLNAIVDQEKPGPARKALVLLAKRMSMLSRPDRMMFLMVIAQEDGRRNQEQAIFLSALRAQLAAAQDVEDTTPLKELGLLPQMMH